ncbi:MAG: hypothetical protein U0412_03020 [Nitrospira sp.]
MYILIGAFLLGLLIWGLMSRNGVVRLLAKLIVGGLTLLSLLGMVFLFGVGQKAHWPSDGPGMLFIMIGVVACGCFTFLFGGLLFQSGPAPDAHRLSQVRDLLHPPARSHQD